jgi:hypothetical protein
VRKRKAGPEGFVPSGCSLIFLPGACRRADSGQKDEVTVNPVSLSYRALSAALVLERLVMVHSDTTDCQWAGFSSPSPSLQLPMLPFTPPASLHTSQASKDSALAAQPRAPSLFLLELFCPQRHAGFVARLFRASVLDWAGCGVSLQHQNCHQRLCAFSMVDVASAVVYISAFQTAANPSYARERAEAAFQPRLCV